MDGQNSSVPSCYFVPVDWGTELRMGSKSTLGSYGSKENGMLLKTMMVRNDDDDGGGGHGIPFVVTYPV